MEERGEIHTGNDGRVTTPNRAGLISGKMLMTMRGYGLVDSGGRMYYILAEDMNRALHGDYVQAKATKHKRQHGNDKSPARPGTERAIVLKVLERGLKNLTGIYMEHKGFARVTPDESRLGFQVLVAPEDASTAR